MGRRFYSVLTNCRVNSEVCLVCLFLDNACERNFKIAVSHSFIYFTFSEFIHAVTTRTSDGDIDDAELLLLSWVHSQPKKLIKSLIGIEGLGKPRLQNALQDALKELPSIAKKFVPMSESNAIYVHNDAVASLAHSPPRGNICNEALVSSSLVFVKACLALHCQSRNMDDFREYLVGNPVALQALYQWLMEQGWLALLCFD